MRAHCLVHFWIICATRTVKDGALSRPRSPNVNIDRPQVRRPLRRPRLNTRPRRLNPVPVRRPMGDEHVPDGRLHPVDRSHHRYRFGRRPVVAVRLPTR